MGVILKALAILFEAKGFAALATKLVDPGCGSIWLLLRLRLRTGHIAATHTSVSRVMRWWRRCVWIVVVAGMLTGRGRKAMLRGSAVDLRSRRSVRRMVIRLWRWWRRRNMLHPAVGRRSWRLIWTKLVLKGRWIAFQDRFSRQLNVNGMHRGIVAILTATLGATCRADGKTLAVKLQAT